MRSPLDALVTRRVLERLYSTTPDSFFEYIPDELSKNVCAKVAVSLSDEIDYLVVFLGCSKRVFLEASFLDAVHKAREIIALEIGDSGSLAPMGSTKLPDDFPEDYVARLPNEVE